VIAKGEQPPTADESFVPIWGCSRDGLTDQVQGPGAEQDRAGAGGQGAGGVGWRRFAFLRAREQGLK
jgi:hypothetical protein